MKVLSAVLLFIFIFTGLSFAEDSLQSARDNYYKGKISEAYKQITKALESGDERLDVFYYAGIIYSDFGETGKSIEILFTGLQKFPKNEKLLTIAGRNFIRAGRYLEGLSVLKELITLGNKDSRVREYAGDASVGLGRYKDAESYYKKALELNPGEVWVYIKLGRVQKRMKKFKDSRNSFSTALKKAREQNINLLTLLAEHELKGLDNN
ncbi:MAG TPA: tetratricopeptide repeat protein [Firmicutes bacterium]|nr:tetratricopeptide repeat protein [Bacillota bacterium]